MADSAMTVPLEEGAKKPASSGKAMGFAYGVELVLFLFYLGHGPELNLLQQYVYTELANQHDVTADKDHCSNTTDEATDLVEKLTSNWNVMYSAAVIVPEVIVTLWVGSYSDRIGRKVTMLLPVMGYGVEAFLCICIVSFQLDINLFYIGGFLHGLCGGQGTFLMSCYAMVAEQTSSATRSRRLLILTICRGLAEMTTQLATGYLIKGLGFTYPILIALAALATTSVVVLIIIPDIRPAPRPEATEHRMGILRATDIFIKEGTPPRRLKMNLSLSILGLACFLDVGSRTVQTTYKLSPPLCFSSVTVGVNAAVTAASANFGALIMLFLLHSTLGDPGLSVVASLAMLLFYVITGIATRAELIFIAVIFCWGSSLNLSLNKAFLSKHLSTSEQGALFGAIHAFEDLTRVSGSISLNSLYSATLGLTHGFVFYIIAIGSFAQACICGLIVSKMRKEKEMTLLLSNQEIGDQE